MATENAEPNWVELLQMRMYSVLRADEDYDKIYQQRIARLNAMAALGGHVGESAQAAKELTDLAHESAENLKTQIQMARTFASRDNQSVINAIISQDRTATSTISTVPAVDRIREAAYEFMLWASSGADLSLRDRFIGDVIEERFAECGEIERNLITQTVARLYLALKSERSHQTLARLFADLGAIYRGLLYAGVMNKWGSDLARKEIRDQVRGAAIEFGGHAIPGLGLLAIVAELLNLADVDEPLAIAKKAAYVDRYLAFYSSALVQYTKLITAYATVLESTKSSAA